MGSFGEDMAKARRDREQLDPEDFEFCAEYYVGPDDGRAAEFSREPWPDDCCIPRESLGVCRHCGTRHYYGALFRDRRDGSYIAVGNACASKFFCFKSRKDYLVAQAKRQALANANKADGLRKAEEFLAGRDDFRSVLEVNHPVVRDIREKLFRFGFISDKQIELVYRIAEWEKESSEDPSPDDVPDEVLTGRVLLTGTVLGFKMVESDWGTTEKVLVREDRGFKLFGTAPKAEKPYDKGDRISFVARVERSNRDSSFGFFSRPTQATVQNPTT